MSMALYSSLTEGTVEKPGSRRLGDTDWPLTVTLPQPSAVKNIDAEVMLSGVGTGR